MTSQGCVDFLCYAPSLDGWLAGGWIDLGWDDQDEAPHCALELGEKTISGDAVVITFPRADVRKIGYGLILFVPGENTRAEGLQDVILTRHGQSFRLTPSEPLDHLTEADGVARTKALVSTAMRSSRRAHLLRLLSRPAFAGHDTLDQLQPPVFLELDSASLCPPDGLLLRGWMLDPFKSVESIRLRCAGNSAVIDPDHFVPIARPDVREGFSKQFGGLSDLCGFLAYAAGVYQAGEIVYFEVRTVNGDIGFKRVQQVRSPGIDTIKDTLGHLELRYEAMERAYDHVLGPAVKAMNAFRLQKPVGYREMSLGVQPEAPRCTIIVPLYGRIDFMELQLAFFSRTLGRQYEIIYVLDDPNLERATEALATSCLARFRLPFRLVVLDANVGYAPANNVGLTLARGEYVCFLNSDVFPKTPDWLDHMVETADARPDVGVVGALLVFEDETVQHEGCSYEILPEFAGWTFSLHPRKGRFPSDDDGIAPADAITGACLMMPTSLARAVGGLDEGYVIGDFEDVDLCRKAQAMGKQCVVDRRARLYHLERQSQGGQQSFWRLNLTLYNAWRFQNRWTRGTDPWIAPAETADRPA
ncbi:glycosyltransferase [Acetobacteraceae bacterium KSS8]|uniref:Glycosyltransferase n=1 Tax=Endosaccharibacter trunci TaxID=2812733 RepID=A0ABT1W8U6_9PROT|nr:glycosyltransferase [Acetobacteraceae bacterium KSS8]